MHVSKEIVLTSKNFESEVMSSKLPVIVDCWAPDCSPCQLMEPIVDRLAYQFDGRLKVGMLDVHKYGSLARRFHVSGIPSLLLFRDGNLVHQIIGLQPQEALQEAVRVYLKVS